MKYIFLFLMSLAMTFHANAQKKSSTRFYSKPKTIKVKTYTRKDGTRVKAHKRSAPSRRSRTFYMLPGLINKGRMIA